MPSSYANIEHVAPISAPMLHIVALPVQLREDAPGPKYSTIEFVPPDTPSSPEGVTFSMTSFGEVHPLDFPTSFTPINFRPTWTDCTCEGYYAENFGMSLWSKPKDGDDIDDFCALKNCPVVSHVLCHEMLRRSGYKRHEQDVHEVWMRHYHGGFALRTYDVNHVETKEKPLFTTIDVQAVTALSH